MERKTLSLSAIDSPLFVKEVEKLMYEVGQMAVTALNMVWVRGILGNNCSDRDCLSSVAKEGKTFLIHTAVCGTLILESQRRRLTCILSLILSKYKGVVYFQENVVST